jgi:putative transposase
VTAPADPEHGDDHSPAAAGPGAGGALREPPAAAVQAPHRHRGPTPPDALPHGLAKAGLGKDKAVPQAKARRCWNHRILNLLDKLPKRLHAEGRRLLTAIPYAETREAAEHQKRAFQTWCAKKGVAAVGQALDHDWDRLVASYDSPKAHWQHLRTSNPIESPFAAVRLRTAAAKRYKKVENATAVIWKTLLIAERTFRRLDAPELLAEVAEDVTYVNGDRVKPSQTTAERKAAA